jgi:hypothetical protein
MAFEVCCSHPAPHITDRIDTNFDDANTDVVTKVIAAIPEAKTMEMETFVLLHLAQCAKISVRASACAIVVCTIFTCKYSDNFQISPLDSSY